MPETSELITAARQADGFTPPMGAAQNGALGVTELLLAHGADAHARVDAQAGNFAGMTALDFARQAGASEVVRVVEQAGAK